MHGLLRQAWADNIQVGAVPLEVVGLVLAWIEVRNPPLAARITRLLVRTGQVRYFGYPREGGDPVAVRIFTVLHAIALVAFWAWFLTGHWQLPVNRVVGLVELLIALVFPIAAASLLLRGLAYVLTALTRFSGGRALGAFGLVLATLGMLGSAYQVATLWFGSDGAT
jgi:fatty acid desaturase